jgi:hypothetical protein
MMCHPPPAARRSCNTFEIADANTSFACKCVRHSALPVRNKNHQFTIQTAGGRDTHATVEGFVSKNLPTLVIDVKLLTWSSVGVVFKVIGVFMAGSVQQTASRGPSEEIINKFMSIEGISNRRCNVEEMLSKILDRARREREDVLVVEVSQLCWTRRHNVLVLGITRSNSGGVHWVVVIRTQTEWVMERWISS